jgi:hypothetical protein
MKIRGANRPMSVKSSLELMFVCLLFLAMPTLNKTYLFIYLSFGQAIISDLLPDNPLITRKTSNCFPTAEK